MAYSVSDIESIITNLEGSLAVGYADISYEGRHLQYRSVAEIRNAIAYFKGLLPMATDAPAVTKLRVRTAYLFTSKGFKI